MDFPSWNGYIYAVNANDGSVIWKQHLQNLTGIPPTGTFANVTDTVSRSTPTVAGDKLIIAVNGPAYVIAVQRATGHLLWSTKLDNNSLSIVTYVRNLFSRVSELCFSLNYLHNFCHGASLYNLQAHYG